MNHERGIFSVNNYIVISLLERIVSKRRFFYVPITYILEPDKNRQCKQYSTVSDKVLHSSVCFQNVILSCNYLKDMFQRDGSFMYP